MIQHNIAKLQPADRQQHIFIKWIQEKLLNITQNTKTN